MNYGSAKIVFIYFILEKFVDVGCLPDFYDTMLGTAILFAFLIGVVVDKFKKCAILVEVLFAEWL